MAESQVSSLRDRSKARRRAAVVRAGLRLFAERGYSGTTIADIAEAAEVAPRTVALYFPSKADIALAWARQIVARLSDSVSSHPGVDFLDVLDQWLTTEAEIIDVETASLAMNMFDANPDLAALSRSLFDDAIHVLPTALHARVGVDPDDPILGVVDAAVSGALTQYIGIISRGGSSPALHRRFMEYLRRVIEAPQDM